MKNFFKLMGVIAVIAVIGFSMAACNDGGDGGGNNNNNNTDGSGSLSGSYNHESGSMTITFSGSNWSVTGLVADSGTYTVSGTTLNITHKDGTKETWTIVDATHLKDDHNETWTKK
jgi:hypothetical protein